MVSEQPSTGAEELETVSKWNGETYVSSLEASNGVTKCRGIVFRPEIKCSVNSFTFHLRLKRGNGVAFLPIVGPWQAEHGRMPEIKFRGEMQEITQPAFTEFTCSLPPDGILAGPDEPLMLGFYTEECTSHRSSAADIAQIPDELVAAPAIPHSLYLNGKFATGTWRTYDSTLACRVLYTPT